jgi:hypothetical protein
MSRSLAAILLIVLASVGAGRTTAAQQGATGTYPLTLTRGSRLLVAAMINGHPVEALLDSAAEATLIDPRLAHELNLAPGTAAAGQGSGAQGFEAQLIDGVQLEVFGVTLKNQTVATTELGDVGQRLLGRSLEVILGREIFDAARLQIDIAGRRVTVLPEDSKPPGVRLELTTEHGVETVPVRVEGGAPLRATFDLGNGSQVLVGTALAQRLHLLSDGRGIRTEEGGGLGGRTQRQVVELHSLELAGRIFADVPAAIDTQPSASDVNVGVAVLQHFLITTDFARHVVWLQPRP